MQKTRYRYTRAKSELGHDLGKLGQKTARTNTTNLLLAIFVYSSLSSLSWGRSLYTLFVTPFLPPPSLSLLQYSCGDEFLFILLWWRIRHTLLWISYHQLMRGSISSISCVCTGVISNSIWLQFYLFIGVWKSNSEMDSIHWGLLKVVQASNPL